MDFVAIDWETANAFRGSACAVGLVTVRSGVVVDTWGSLMQPPGRCVHFDPSNTAVHGLRAADVLGAPTFVEIWPEIESRLLAAPVIAHNATFDVGVVLDATRSASLPCPELDFGCTLVLSRQHYDLPSNTLDAVAAVAGARLDQHHEAVSDASAAAEIMLAVGRDLGADSLVEAFDAYRIELGRLGGPNPRSCRVRPAAPPVVEDVPTLW